MQRLTFKQIAPFLIVALFSVAALFALSFAPKNRVEYNSADVAWIIVATALVFLIMPGLTFFYSGIVGLEDVLSTMMKSVVAAGVVSVTSMKVGTTKSTYITIGSNFQRHNNVLETESNNCIIKF